MRDDFYRDPRLKLDAALLLANMEPFRKLIISGVITIKVKNKARILTEAEAF